MYCAVVLGCTVVQGGAVTMLLYYVLSYIMDYTSKVLHSCTERCSKVSAILYRNIFFLMRCVDSDVAALTRLVGDQSSESWCSTSSPSSQFNHCAGYARSLPAAAQRRRQKGCSPGFRSGIREPPARRRGTHERGVRLGPAGAR